MGEISFVCVFDTDRRNQRWDLCGCGGMCGAGPRTSYVSVYSTGCTPFHPPSSHFVSIHSLPSSSLPSNSPASSQFSHYPIYLFPCNISRIKFPISIQLFSYYSLSLTLPCCLSNLIQPLSSNPFLIFQSVCFPSIFLILFNSFRVLVVSRLVEGVVVLAELTEA